MLTGTTFDVCAIGRLTVSRSGCPFLTDSFISLRLYFPTRELVRPARIGGRMMQIKLPQDAAELRILFFPTSSDYRRNGRKTKRAFALEESTEARQLPGTGHTLPCQWGSLLQPSRRVSYALYRCSVHRHLQEYYCSPRRLALPDMVCDSI